MGQHGASAEHLRGEVHVDAPAPLLVGELLQGGPVTRRAAARVVDQYIDSAELVDGLRHHRFDGLGVGNIGRNRDGLAAALGDQFGRLLKLRERSRRAGNLRAGIAVGQRHGATEAASRSGEQDDLTVEAESIGRGHRAPSVTP